MDARLQKQWDRKSALLKNEEALNTSELFLQKAAVYAEFGKVICIGAGFFTPDKKGDLTLRVKAFSGHDEKQLLQDFKRLLDEKMDPGSLQLCAHNGKEFDFPFLCRRYLINDLEIPLSLQVSGKKPWEIPHLDTMEMWRFGDRKNFTSLELLASIFGIGSSKTDLDGSRVNEVYYVEKDLPKIVEYCMHDVLVTANLFLKLNRKPVIPDENVYFLT